MQVLAGLSAALSSGLYLLSDLIELGQGGFSVFQLALTYVAEAAIPLYVIGLYAVQRPRIKTLGLAGALGYAYAYIFFTSTVVYTLANGIRDWAALQKHLGPWITIHGALMVLAGIAFGLAVVRARVLPSWTGYTLMAGVCLVALAQALPAFAQTVAAAVRDVAFIAMGVAVLRLQPAQPAERNAGRNGAR